MKSHFQSFSPGSEESVELHYQLGYQKAKDTRFGHRKFSKHNSYPIHFTKKLRGKIHSIFDWNQNGIFCFYVELKFTRYSLLYSEPFWSFFTQYVENYWSEGTP